MYDDPPYARCWCAWLTDFHFSSRSSSRYDSEYDNFRRGNVTSDCEESDFFQEDFDIDSDVGNILDKAAANTKITAAAAAGCIPDQKEEKEQQLKEVAKEIGKKFGLGGKEEKENSDTTAAAAAASETNSSSKDIAAAANTSKDGGDRDDVN